MKREDATVRPEMPSLAVTTSPVSRPGDWLLSIGSVAICTALSFIFSSHLALVDLAMLYLLGIVFTASRTGKWPSLLATVLSVAAFDFFFVPPFFTLAVSEPKYVLTFAVMFVVYLITSRLTLHIREQAEAASRRESRTSALYHLSRELAQVRDFKRLGAVAIRHIGDLVSRQAAILVPDERGGFVVTAAGSGMPVLDEKQKLAARQVFDESKRGGADLPLVTEAGGLYVPLVAATRTIGVVVVLPDSPATPFHQEQVDLLQGLTNQVAMALERAMLADEAQGAQLKAEKEVLRSALLSSVSHDLRTPLAVITGASTALLNDDSLLDQSGRQELTRTICEEAERLNRIIRNVLDMTRIDSGAIEVKKEWQSLEEIVGAVLDRLREKAGARRLTVRIPPDLPLIPFDPLLMEQALTNLMENALKHTPVDAPIDLSASASKDHIIVEIGDRGPGIRPGDEERLFEKFVRCNSPAGGIGLGLAICKAIIEAHGGKIWAENRPGGGALFRFTIPVEGKPPHVEPERQTPYGSQQKPDEATSP
ncbi:MAG: DUF4118 domain-containing protein [Chloroflexota bacterium]